MVYAELLRLVALKEAGSPLPKIAPFPPEEGIKIEPAIIKDFAIRAQAALGTSEPNARMRAALAGVTTQAQLVEAIALNMRDAFGIIDRFSPSAADPLRELATLRGQSQKRALFTERYEKFAEEMHLCRIPRDVDDAVARHSPGLIAVFDKNDPVAGRQVFDAHKLLVQDLIDDALALAAEVDKSRNQTGTQLSIPVLRETRNGITVELRETFDGCEFTLSYPNSIRGRRGLVSDIKREVKHKLAGLGALSPFKSDVATASISFHLRACDVNPGEVETRFHTLVAVLSDKRNIKDVLGEHGGIFGGKRSVLRMGNSFHLNQFLHGVGYEFDPLGSDSRERRVYFAGAQNMDLTGAVFGREVKFAPGMKFTRCFARAGGTKRGMFVSELIAADPKFHDSPLDISTEVNGLNSPSGDLPIIYLFSRGSADAKKPSGAA